MAFYPSNPRPQVHGNYPEIVKLFNTAKSNLKFPKLRISIDGIAFQVYPAGTDSRNRGYLYVKRGSDYLGKIAPNGDYFGAPEFAQQLAKFNENPVSCATMYGKETGACCFCGIALTDGRSVAVGYGPICAEKWGLPWGEEKIEPTVTLVDLDFSEAEMSIIGSISDSEKEEMLRKSNAIAASLEQEEHAYGAIYYLSKDIDKVLDSNAISMRPEEMASTIVFELKSEYGVVSYLEEIEKHIIRLLTTYPILRE